jgi:hypothetical protein
MPDLVPGNDNLVVGQVRAMPDAAHDFVLAVVAAQMSLTRYVEPMGWIS